MDISKLNVFQNPLKMFFPKKMVGIDIGTGSIKVVELSRWGQGKTLENYGQVQSLSLYKEGQENGSYLLSNYFIARAIKAILDEAKIRTKEAIFAIPDFQCFSTSFELPPMSSRELPEAVYYAAPQYIPLPITETTLDWKLIKGEPGKKTPLKVFLVAIPNQVIQDYQNIAQLAGLELYAVESEVLGLARSVVKERQTSVCLVDLGMQSTTISLVSGFNVKRSYSFDFTGAQLTHAIASVLGVSQAEAEQLKNKEGLISSQVTVRDALYLLIDPLLMELRKVLSEFAAEEGSPIDKVLLTGGAAVMPGLKEYFQETLRKPVEIPNCFAELLHPPILSATLKKIAPSFSVAAGVALGGLEV